MLTPIEKPAHRPLVHHPSDVLDLFCHYDATSDSWIDFDNAISQQIVEFEARHPQYLRLSVNANRRKSNGFGR